VDGQPGWTLAGDTGTPARPHHGVRLLPYLDAYVVAGQPRQLLYPGAAAARALTPAGQRSRLLVLNSPQNPCGSALTGEDCAEIAEIAQRHDLTVLSDEVYWAIR